MKNTVFEFVLSIKNATSGNPVTIVGTVAKVTTVSELFEAFEEFGSVLINRFNYARTQDGNCLVRTTEDQIVHQDFILSARLSPQRFVFP